jgi:hypothetical protein
MKDELENNIYYGDEEIVEDDNVEVRKEFLSEFFGIFIKVFFNFETSLIQVGPRLMGLFFLSSPNLSILYFSV